MKINLDNCVKQIKKKLHNNSDLKERNVRFFSSSLCILYFADLVDTQLTNDNIVRPILEYKGNLNGSIMSTLTNFVVSDGEIELCPSIDKAIQKMLKGFVAIVVDGESQILCVNAEKIVVRPVSIPPNSTVIKGPREGFNESLKYNLSLTRKRLATDKLVIKSLTVGTLTQTQVAILYIDGIADKKIVNEITRRIKSIDIDGVIDSSYLAAFLQRKPNSLFKQVGDTEKPDILCAKLLEGRIGVIVDGSPIALTLPFILLEDLQSSDDYYNQHIRISFVRILRLVGIILAILLPGIYVALQLYHYKIIPLKFLITIMNTTQGIPFTPFSEIVFIVLLFEILYEANLRMPQYLGMALSIVGALILGDTAVNAGLVSPPAVMIVALSGLTFYVVPNQSAQFSMLRLMFILFGAVLGLFGIILGVLAVLSYLVSFDSYSSAYLAPLSPYVESDKKDFLFKQSILNMRKRPESIKNNRANLVRMKTRDTTNLKKRGNDEDK